jgi:hypothetical protein
VVFDGWIEIKVTAAYKQAGRIAPLAVYALLGTVFSLPFLIESCLTLSDINKAVIIIIDELKIEIWKV